MASSRDRALAEHREHEDFLKRLEDIDNFSDAWNMVTRGRDASYRSNLGYFLRFGMVPSDGRHEREVIEALMGRLRAKGYRWVEVEGVGTVPHDPQGKPIILQ